MEIEPGQPEKNSSGLITSTELLGRISTAVQMQVSLRDLTDSVAKFTNDTQNGVRMLNDLHAALGIVPKVEGDLLKAYVVKAIALGNFCNAGGKVIFVDPPSENTS